MIQRLDFDSSWFGLEIGRLACPLDAPALDASAQADHFDLIYIVGRSLDVVPLGVIGGRISVVDVRLDLEREPGGAAARNTSAEVSMLATGAEIEEAAEIAGTAFVTSRFYRDLSLKHRAGDLYRTWVTNQKATSAPGSGILGFRSSRSRRLGGFLVFRPDAPCSRIDLIGVAEGRRGEGVGRALVEGLQSLEAARTLRVRVSADNPRALDFYLSAGFRPRSSDVVVHRWRRQ